MWRLDRLETEDSLFDDDDEWLDDAIALIDFLFAKLILCWVFFS